MCRIFRQLWPETGESVAFFKYKYSNLICCYFVVILFSQTVANLPVDSIELESHNHNDDYYQSTLLINTVFKKKKSYPPSDRINLNLNKYLRYESTQNTK